MKRPELYQKTVDILTQAYFNNTLQHGDCIACAVGNIIAGAGVPVCHSKSVDWNEGFNNGSWKGLFFTFKGKQHKNSYGWGEPEIENAKKAIEMTGYSVDEMSQIEFAFETASDIGDYMFNGLMAVVEALDQIHENTDIITTQETKNKFTRKLQTT